MYGKIWHELIGDRVSTKVFILVVFFLASALLAGCSKHKHTVEYADEKLFFGKVPADSCAIGGLVMLHTCRMDAYMGVDYLPSEFTLELQSDLWAPVLEKAFEKRTNKKVAVPWHDFKNRIPEFTREAILESTARDIFVMPDYVAECAAKMPEARWLLLASIRGSKFMSEGLDQYMDQHAQTRILWMGLEIYDMRTGNSVYSSKVRYYGDGPEHSRDSDQRLDKWEESGLDGQYLPNNVVSNLLSAPPLRPTLDKCAGELLKCLTNVGQVR